MDELPLVSPLERAVFLRAQPYLAGLDPTVLAVLASHTREHRAKAGEVLFDAERSLEVVSFIVSGHVRTLVDGETLFEIEAPGGVGLAHGLCREAHPPIAVATTDCLLLQIELTSFVQILEDHFSMVLQLARIFGRLILDSERELDVPPMRPLTITEADHVPAELDLVQRLAWARRAAIFENANLSVLAELLGTATELRLKKGEWLWKVGDDSNAHALLVSGSLLCEGVGRERRAVPGSIVGFTSVFADLPRDFGVRAEGPCVVLRTDRSNILDAMEDHFDLSLDIINALATRHLALRAPRALRGDTKLNTSLF